MQITHTSGQYFLLFASGLLVFYLASPGLLLAEEDNHVAVPPGEYTGIDVEQPIKFPHDIHVEQNKINCLYCHTYARRSKVAGIPPLSKCYGCHKIISTEKPEIQRLNEYWQKASPPLWKKVHDLPDFVHFTHEIHLKKFVFDKELPVEQIADVCALCHGDISKMKVAKKVKPLTMGWCVRCHENNSGSGDCWACHK